MEHDELLRAATYDDAAMVTYLSSTVIATFFHHMRLLVSPDVVLAQIVSTSRGITALKANAIFTTVAMGTRLSLILFLSIIPGGFFQSLPVILVQEMTRPSFSSINSSKIYDQVPCIPMRNSSYSTQPVEWYAYAVFMSCATAVITNGVLCSVRINMLLQSLKLGGQKESNLFGRMLSAHLAY